jgi:hypothetical protein
LARRTSSPIAGPGRAHAHIHDQRTQSYLFGAVCPELGTGAALVLPACNSEAMQLHLDEIATKVTPGAHAIVLLDQAGWHGAKALNVPSNISLMPLPPRAPELNGQENIWQFMRQNWLSNRIFQSFDDIVPPLLPCLEHPHRSAVEDHVHRTARLGQRGLLNVRIGIRHRRVVAVDRRGAAFEARIRRVAGCRRTSNAFATGRRAAPPAALKLLRVVLYCSLTMSREPL